MKVEERKGLRTWIEINTESIDGNYRKFRSMVPEETKICSVVKSNAYGHFLIDFSKRMEKNGVDHLAVDTILEGLRLRREGVGIPIMVLGYTLPEMFSEASDNDISITVSGWDTLNRITERDHSGRFKIHLKFDTGMNRQGFREEEVSDVLKTLREKNGHGVVIEGIYTHLADAKDPTERMITEEQIKTFQRVRDAFTNAGLDPLVHVCATAGAINYPEAHFDMVRIGIGMYGLWPSDRTREFASDRLDLERVLSWKTVVSDVKEASAGSGIGYGFTERVERDSRFAVLPVGYWHGYCRSLSSRSSVLIRGKRAKVLGLISMDIMMVDVTDIQNIKVGDEVTLIGVDGKEEISPEELAFMAGTTNYEIVTRINPLIKKFYR